MRGHTDTVTGFRLSPDGSFLLSNAMDNTGKHDWLHQLSCRSYPQVIEIFRLCCRQIPKTLNSWKSISSLDLHNEINWFSLQSVFRSIDHFNVDLYQPERIQLSVYITKKDWFCRPKEISQVTITSVIFLYDFGLLRDLLPFEISL